MPVFFHSAFKVYAGVQCTRTVSSQTTQWEDSAGALLSNSNGENFLVPDVVIRFSAQSSAVHIASS